MGLFFAPAHERPRRRRHEPDTVRLHTMLAFVHELDHEQEQLKLQKKNQGYDPLCRRMSASLLLRSACDVVRRSIPEAQASFHRSPVRLLSGGAGRFEPSEHSGSRPNMGDTQREYGQRICRAAESQNEWTELASEVRAVRDQLRVVEQKFKETDEWDTRREKKMLACACVILIAACVFA